MSLLKGKRKVPNIVRGGRAIPFGNPSDNLYYLQGRSHAKGGIDIGSNPRTGIEAEGGEVVQIKPNELRVLSAQDFIGSGVSPAKQVLAGANPDQVFNDQERFKDRHRLNDDGSKYQDGGIIRPDPLTPEGKKYYAKISGAANPINPEFDLVTSFISVPRLITLGAKGSALGFRNGRIIDVIENTYDKLDKFNNYINNSIIKGIKPVVNYIDRKVPDKYRKQYRNITKKIVETGLSNDYAKPIINGTVGTIRDNSNKENNQKRNGGIANTISGNIKNDLIVTPRKKYKEDGDKTYNAGILPDVDIVGDYNTYWRATKKKKANQIANAVRQGTSDFINDPRTQFITALLPLPGPVGDNTAALDDIARWTAPYIEKAAKPIRKVINKAKDKIDELRGYTLAEEVPHREIEGYAIEGRSSNILSLDSPRGEKTITTKASIPSSEEPIILSDTSPSKAAENREFLKRFNIWNRRYGYDPIPLNVSKSTAETDRLVKERLLEHNTFTRGVRHPLDETGGIINRLINEKANKSTRDSDKLFFEMVTGKTYYPIYDDGHAKRILKQESRNRRNLRNALKRKGIIDDSMTPEQMKDIELDYMATHTIGSTGHGRAGQVKPYNNYASNSYDTSAGYATSNYFYNDDDPIGRIYKIRRKLNFDGNRNDWIQEAEFTLNNERDYNPYYESLELPYLMKTGRSLQSDIVKGEKINLAKIKMEAIDSEYDKLFNDEKFKDIMNYYGLQKYDFGYNSPKEKDIRYRQMKDIINVHNDPLIPKKRKVQAVRNIFKDKTPYTSVDTRESKKYRNIIKREYADKREELLDKYAKEYAAKEGIYPRDNTTIYTTETKRTTTRKGDKEPYMHFIYGSDKIENVYDIIEKYDDVLNYGNPQFGRAHRGKFTKGLSRKSKENGGMIFTINGNIKNGLISTPRYKCGGRKKAPNGTVTDVNTRGIAAPDLWMNTIGQDNAVYDMATNDMISGNRMAMRHADMREDLDYQSGSGRAIRGSGQVRQYQKDFQNRFWDANRLLHNATDPAGVTGDNQSGESNDDIWGEKTNVRTPYGLWSDKNRQMWNDRGFLAANYKGNTVLSGRIADLSKLELPALPKAPTLNAPVGKLATMPSSTGDNAKSPLSPTNPTPRRGIVWNDDLTSALANGLGSLGSFGAELWGSNLRGWTPYTESPVKLKTNYNINPQLDRIRESSQEAYRDIDANTASSSTALARKQRIRNQAQYAANEQWGLKENKETQLINQDKLNLQGVRNRNTNRLNHWAESDANIANTRRRLRGAAWSNVFDNLNKTVQGYIGRKDQRRRDEATERMFNRAYPHGAAMTRNIQSRESSGDATIPSLATNPIAITGRLATERLNDDIVAQTKKRCGGKTKRK